MQAMVTSVIATWRASYNWCAKFDDRELAEIIFAIHYHNDMQHGTSGHLAYNIIAKLFLVLTEDKHGIKL